jgi:hypothetical protein
MKRIQFDVTPAGSKVLKEIQIKTASSTRKDVLENSIALLEWAIDQVERGRIVGAFDEDKKTFHELLMPSLSRVKKSKAD